MSVPAGAQAPTDPYGRLVFSLQYSHGLDPQMVAEISSWLRGGTLSSPQAIAYVSRFFPGGLAAQATATSGQYHPGPVAGQGPAQSPAAQPATSPPSSAQGARQAGDPNAPGSDPGAIRQQPSQSAGGLASNYIATKVAAAQQGKAAPMGAGLATGASTAAAAQTAPPVVGGQPTQQPKASGTAMASGFGGPVMGNGGHTTDQGAALLDPSGGDLRLSVILRQMGFDPTRPGIATRRIAQEVGPYLDAAAQFAGLGPGGDGTFDPTQAGSMLRGVAQSFLTPGQNAYASARQFAQGVLANPNFQSAMSDNQDNVTQAMLQNLLPLLYGGANPVVQAAEKARLGRLIDQYNLAGSGFDTSGNPADLFKGNFSDYTQNTDRGRALYNLIYGGGA